MKKCLALVTLLAAFSTQAATCAPEDITINVLPLEVKHDYTLSFEDMQRLGYGFVGAVVTTATARIDGCTVTVGWRDTTLYVIRELKRNQCAFDHVLEHEEEHIRIYRRARETLEARIREAAKTLSLQEAAEREVLAVRAAHRAHDSPEEYAKNDTACNGRVRRLAYGR
jgi:hypothetical protein